MVHVTKDTALTDAHEHLCEARDRVIEAVRRWYVRGDEVGLADAYSNLLRAERLLANTERGR